MNEGTSSSAAKTPPREPIRTKLITFWHGIVSATTTPFVTDAFRISQFSEEEIAKWTGLRKVTSKKIFYPDGRSSESRSLLGPQWDVHYKTEDPSYLGTKCATDFGYSHSTLVEMRGGAILSTDRRSSLTHLLLRLTRRGDVFPVLERIFYDGEPNESRNGHIISTEPPSDSPEWATWLLNEQSQKVLRRLLKVFWPTLLDNYLDWPDDCMVSANHFIKALCFDRVDRELNLWIALEAMFSPSDNAELRHRIARSAAVFTVPLDKRYETYKLVADRYDRRSKMVHGSDQPSKVRTDMPYADSWAEHCRLEDIVRIALRRYLRCRLKDQMSRKALLLEIEKESIQPTEAPPFSLDPGEDPALD